MTAEYLREENPINLITSISLSLAFPHEGYKVHKIFKTVFYISSELDRKYIVSNLLLDEAKQGLATFSTDSNRVITLGFVGHL